ncbi:kallikrein-14-like isoform X2 [Drosophila rhopaloa]|uniref:Kallikrein-14-like isoform X2 n=1 Tax=Drosophila rhopaloa TaxID=1041015 RepID=A0A6P4F224_DRORH|nr:kallikrein-14-like isoform X2 [Drosophila rhopaloa]
MTSPRCIAFCTLLLFQNGLSIFLDQNCGLIDSSKSRTPWLANILTEVEHKFICSGTLINRRYVLTTATCLQNRPAITVCLGKCDSFSDDVLYKNARYRIPHESYSSSNHQNDIGLINLQPNKWSNSHMNGSLWSGIRYKPKHKSSICSEPPCKAIGKPLSIPDASNRSVQHGILSFQDSKTNAYVYTNVFEFIEWLVEKALDIDIIVSLPA